MKTYLYAILIGGLSPLLGIAQEGGSQKPLRLYGYLEGSLLGRQIAGSTTNAEPQMFRLFGLTTGIGMTAIEGLPEGVSFGLSIDTDQESIELIQGYDQYGTITKWELQHRRSNYSFEAGMTFGQVRLMGVIGAENRGHVRTYAEFSDGTIVEMTEPYQFAGIPDAAIFWKIEPKISLAAGGNITWVAPKFFLRGQIMHNFGEVREKTLGRIDLTYRPNPWFGIGGSAEQAFLQGTEVGAHLAFGFGHTRIPNSWLALRFGPTIGLDRNHGIGWAGSLVFSFDHRHSKAAASKNAEGGGETPPPAPTPSQGTSGGQWRSF